MSKVILHPACSHSPAAVRAVEQATGLVAIRTRGGPRVIQLVKPATTKEVA
ncbi:hypothetical protein [Paludibacterium purpuratum]|uniref:Uncharacterized protein n=1 Tax=Paludibacterium purpuratum TaxID=1144873 RepID=A0A4R7BEI5_9NEIS|nr:hypothetical protein [Paludibacterium purpuratum]TDR82176.1 hypothetical protein DFP86_102290 [Paludibacterium purpuratum]